MRLGITVKELKETPPGGITDLNIAWRLVAYSIKYNDHEILLKIKPELVREALIEYIKTKQ